MPVVSCEKDPNALALVITAHFDAPPERAWQLWTDPRQLERWWGPPGFTTTFTTFELTPGGRIDYTMTSPDGEDHHDWWRVVAVDLPHTLDLADGLAYESGAPDPEMPVSGMLVAISEHNGGSAMTVTTSFPSAEAMEEHNAIGFEEFMTMAMNKMDTLLSSPLAS